MTKKKAKEIYYLIEKCKECDDRTSAFEREYFEVTKYNSKDAVKRAILHPHHGEVYAVAKGIELKLLFKEI